MAEKNPAVVAAVRHGGDTYTMVFCINGDVYRVITSPTDGTVQSMWIHNIFPKEPEPQPASQQVMD